jgi:hypothetical protein
MLLFQKRFHEGLKSGAVTLTFRHWGTPRVKVGGRYRCHPIGVLEVDAVSRVRVKDIGEQDAVQSGFASRAELMEYLGSAPNAKVGDDAEIFRVVLHYGGDGDRVAIALDEALSAEDVATLTKKLARLDGDAPWTMATLRIIEEQPQVAARILAKKLGRERDPFKVDVRKLKRLGLTQSFELGYEISPRGRAYLEAIRGK